MYREYELIIKRGMIERKPFREYLTDDGLTASALSDYNIKGDFTTDTDYYVEVPEGKVYELSSLRINIEDGGGVIRGFYGNNITLAAGEGALVQLIISGITYDLTVSQRVEANFQWNRIAETFRESSGNDSFVIIFNFRDMFITPPVLNPGDKVVFKFKGNISGLLSQTAILSGDQWNT